MGKHLFKSGELKNITFCCQDCGGLICIKTAIHGNGRCYSCRIKDKENNIQIKNITFCCQDCGNKIIANTALYGDGRCAFCCRKKEKHPLFGKKHSLKTKLRMSEAQKGRKVSEETRQKISLNNKGKQCGENSPCWNPNISNEERINKRHIPQNIIWIQQVFKRDNYNCQCCNKNGGTLNAHHLEGYHWCKELRFEVSNGVTLCKDCHDTFHKKFRNGNNTKEQFYQFQKELKNG